jgi:hypothetical protein
MVEIRDGYQMYFAILMMGHQCQKKKCKNGMKAEIRVPSMLEFLN